MSHTQSSPLYEEIIEEDKCPVQGFDCLDNSGFFLKCERFDPTGTTSKEVVLIKGSLTVSF